MFQVSNQKVVDPLTISKWIASNIVGSIVEFTYVYVSIKKKIIFKMQELHWSIFLYIFASGVLMWENHLLQQQKLL
jgi:hypothetical protein